MKKWQAITLVFSIIVMTMIVVFTLLVFIVMKDREREIDEKKQIIMYETNEILMRLDLLSENGGEISNIEQIELLMSELDNIEYEVERANWCSTESIQFKMACDRYKANMIYSIAQYRINAELMLERASNSGDDEKEEVDIAMENKNIRNITIRFLNTNYH